MRYNIKRIFCTTALALVLGLTGAGNVWAQGAISLSDDGAKPATNDDIPDEISLFGDDTETSAPSLGLSAQDTDKSKSATYTPPPGLPPLGGPALIETPSMPAIPEIPSESDQINSIAAPEIETSVRINQLGGQVVEEIDDDVFQQMSDLEKQTAVLTLELRKEKVKNDIEALKAIQNKAREEEEARKDAEKLKIIVAEKEQEKKILLEQQKLKNLEIVYEKIRQEKLLKAYKNQMLQQNQRWIEQKGNTYKEIEELRKEREKIVNDFKGKFIQLTRLADQATNEVIKVRDTYAKTISDLQTQISILRARLEATERTNPFAESGTASTNAQIEEEIAKLSDLYAVMEIRGKGSNLVAKLINDSGTPFMVKIGTALQTGHVIDEITETYVRADKEGTKDYLYFSAGGILDKEPSQNEELKVRVSEPASAPAQAPSKSIISSQGIPGIASEMTIR